MAVKLSVPFAEKDQAKRLGARWSVEDRCWYAAQPQSYGAFVRWMNTTPWDTTILCKELWLFRGMRRCHHCAHRGPVYMPGAAEFITIHHEEQYRWHAAPVLFTELSTWPDELMTQLHRWVQAIHGSGVISEQTLCRCAYCGTVMGTPFDEQSPFVLEQPEDAYQLYRARIALSWDVVVSEFRYRYDDTHRWLWLAQEESLDDWDELHKLRS